MKNNITVNRLIEAITKFDPDGNAIERVLAAAKRTLELKKAKKGAWYVKKMGGFACSDNESCLLARAWSNDKTRVYVGCSSFDTYKENGAFMDAKSHGCYDVIKWFDRQSPYTASQKIIDALETTI